MTHPTSPYLLDEPPMSTGRALLARALAQWCVVHYGHSPEEIASAFDASDGDDPVVRREVGTAARLLGELIAAGRMKTYARPFGGGILQAVPEAAWELDDFRPRMARSALDPTRPYDDASLPTHWLFVDVEQFNSILDESCGRLPGSAATTTDQEPAPTGPAAAAATARVPEDRHVRLPELIQRTGMSRSTIYRRIERERFPQQLEIDGNIAAWRESDVAAWLADPR